MRISVLNTNFIYLADLRVSKSQIARLLYTLFGFIQRLVVCQPLELETLAAAHLCGSAR